MRVCPHLRIGPVRFYCRARGGDLFCIMEKQANGVPIMYHIPFKDCPIYQSARADAAEAEVARLKGEPAAAEGDAERLEKALRAKTCWPSGDLLIQQCAFPRVCDGIADCQILATLAAHEARVKGAPVPECTGRNRQLARMVLETHGGCVCEVCSLAKELVGVEEVGSDNTERA